MWAIYDSLLSLNIVSNIYLGHEAAALAGTIGAAIIVGVLGLPLTAIIWCGPGEPSTCGKTNLVSIRLRKENFFNGNCRIKSYDC